MSPADKIAVFGTLAALCFAEAARAGKFQDRVLITFVAAACTFNAAVPLLLAIKGALS